MDRLTVSSIISFLVITFIDPPTAPEPYNVAEDPPLTISILSIDVIGICEKLIFAISISFNLLPFTKISTFDFDASPISD